MSAIANPRPTARLTRNERFAALREAGHGYAAPEYKIGDAVMFEGRRSIVEDFDARGGIVTVRNYAGTFMIGRTHPELQAIA